MQEKRNSKSRKTWQQRKGDKTRALIINAVVQCIFDSGYTNISTVNIAKQAGVSRGSLLNYFPHRFDLIYATILHLRQEKWERFEDQERQMLGCNTRNLIEKGVNRYWENLHSPSNIVFNELRTAARTDHELKDIFTLTKVEINRKRQTAIEIIPPGITLSKEFLMANLLTMYLLEGMAMNGSKCDPNSRKVLELLKRQLRRMLDVALTTD